MKIALLSPHSGGPIRGNITTVHRIARSLTEAGCQTAIFPLDAHGDVQLGQSVTAFRPDVIHAFHAQICGERACRLAEELAIPAVVTITGSDLFDRSLRNHPAMTAAMERATSVVCFDQLVADELARYFPGVEARVTIIPQGINPLPDMPAAALNIPDDALVMLMPAALRPVKNIEFLLNLMPRLVRQVPQLWLLIAGGAIDAAYAASLAREAAALPQVLLLGEVPHEAIAGMYRRSQLVVNCSLFEGGTANSLLEAMAQGVAVLASDIAGNRSLVRHGQTGWLYSGEGDFIEKVAWLAAHPQERENMGHQARARVLEKFSAQGEARAYQALYRSLNPGVR